MPRIRKLKLYEQIIPASTWTQRGDEEATSDDAIETSNQTGNVSLTDAFADTGSRGVPADSVSSVSLGGWFSDAAIIATMPDAKLREAYQRYKSLADACLKELTARSVEGRCVRATAEFDVRYGVHRFVPVRGPRYDTTSVGRRARRVAAPKAGQLALTPEQMLSALQMLLTLKRKG